jgi:hypothetical protein
LDREDFLPQRKIPRKITQRKRRALLISPSAALNGIDLCLSSCGKKLLLLKNAFKCESTVTYRHDKLVWITN